MNLKQLEAFKAIMQSGSTISAGRQLKVSQSAVSRLLGQLEAELALSLFLRDRGRLTPTPEAQRLYDEVEELDGALQRLKRLGDDLRAGAAGQALLKVAVPQSLADTIIPGVISDFVAERSGVAVEILSGGYDATERLVASRQADIGFVRLPLEEGGDVKVTPLARTASVCIMPRGHRLAQLKAVDVRALAGVDLVLLGRHRNMRKELDDVLRGSGQPLRCRIETHSVSTACAMVAQGLGVSIVNGMMASFFRALPIEIRPFVPRFMNQYAIVSPAGQPRSRNAEAFATALKTRILAAVKSVES